MTQTDFASALTTDTWFDCPDELIAYRLPVVQYYLRTYTNAMVMLNMSVMLSLRDVNIKYRPQDFCLVNHAYEGIKKLFKEGRLG
jgi:hypothetical protein